MYVITLTSFVRSGYESRSMHLSETKTSPSNNVSVIWELHLKAKQLTLSRAKQVNSQWLYRTVRYLIHSNAQWRYLVIKSWCNCVGLTIRRDVHNPVYTCVPQNSWSDLKNVFFFFFSLLCNILLNNWENSAVVQSVASECPKLHVYLWGKSPCNVTQNTLVSTA